MLPHRPFSDTMGESSMTISQQIEQALDRIRPSLQIDGGGIEVVEIDEQAGILRVRLQGACRGCPMAKMTLKMGVEVAVSEAVPSIKQIIDVDKEKDSPPNIQEDV